MDIIQAIQTILPALEVEKLTPHQLTAFNTLQRALEVEATRKTRVAGFNSGDFFQ